MSCYYKLKEEKMKDNLMIYLTQPPVKKTNPTQDITFNISKYKKVQRCRKRSVIAMW